MTIKYKPRSDEQRARTGAKIFDLTLKVIVKKLQAPALCETCGNTGLTSQELSTLIRFISDMDFKVKPIADPETRIRDPKSPTGWRQRNALDDIPKISKEQREAQDRERDKQYPHWRERLAALTQTTTTAFSVPSRLMDETEIDEQE